MSTDAKKVNRLTTADIVRATGWLQSHRTNMEADKLSTESILTELTAYVGRPITLDQLRSICETLNINWDGGKKVKKGPTKATAVLARVMLLRIEGLPIPEGLLEKLRAIARNEKVPEVGPLFEGGKPS
jgi:hypothetical protein